MSAAQYIGRVGGIAAALGVGIAILSGPAVAGADTDGADNSSRASASESRSESAGPSRRDLRAAAIARSESRGPTRGRGGSQLTESIPDIAPAESLRSAPTALAALDTPAVSEVPAAAATTMTVPAPSATVAAPSATVASPSSEQQLVDVVAPKFAETPPVPTAEVPTRFGNLGQWMINKEGQVADWVGQPYCGEGTTVQNCKPDTPGAKKMQEPINMVFVVQASNQYLAELKLDFAMKAAGFGPSCCSSVGYSGLVRNTDYKQFPRGGPLGLGVLAPLPFGLFQNGLLGLAGFGPAYRDRPFLIDNTHIRTFGGAPDGNGNFIFTASASEENLDTTGGGILPTHGYESFDDARTKLTNGMLRASWLTGAKADGMVDLDNAINPNNPAYTTGDHDGKAQVIVLGSMFGMAPVRTWFNV